MHDLAGSRPAAAEGHAESRGEQDRKEHRPEHGLGLADELPDANERELHERMAPQSEVRRRSDEAAAVHSSRRCRPVSETNTSSSVAECVRSSRQRHALARQLLEQRRARTRCSSVA